jgi:hypothetical protein
MEQWKGLRGVKIYQVDPGRNARPTIVQLITLQHKNYKKKTLL